MNLVPIEVLNAMIANGWGRVPRIKIPPDWETKPGPELNWNKVGRRPKSAVRAAPEVEDDPRDGAE